MTEAEWLTTKLPLYMLREYPTTWDQRNVRLFWCACTCRWWNLLTDERTRQLVEEAERHPEADTDWFVRERRFALEGYINWNNRTHSGVRFDSWALDAFLGTPPGSLMNLVGSLAYLAADTAVSVSPEPVAQWYARERAETAEKAWQCDLIREIFGNPFRRVDVSPWLTSDVKLLARGIYEEKAFDRMPILADALQDAGCDNVNVLDHCRDTGTEHVRGCWVVDLLLGKG